MAEYTPPLPPKDFFLEVEKGNIDGHTAVRVFGHNADIDNGTTEDVWTAGGTLTPMTSAETMNIVSTSTNDDGSPVGTGARTVLVAGLDGTGAPVSEVVTMNGTTNVLTSNSYLRVRRILVLTADSTATNTNIGIITATASTAATVQCHMAAGVGLSQCIHYTTPLAKTAYLYRIELNNAKLLGSTALIKWDAVVTPNGGATFFVVEKATDSDQLELHIDLIPPVAFPALTDVKMTALSDTNDTEVYSRFFIIEVDD